MPLVDARIRCSAGVGTSGRAEHAARHHTVKRPVVATSRPAPFPRPRREPFVSGRLGKDAGSGLGTPLLHTQFEPQELVWTKFVAETVLPTAQGKFKLRGYRHTVRASGRLRLGPRGRGLGLGAPGLGPREPARSRGQGGGLTCPSCGLAAPPRLRFPLVRCEHPSIPVLNAPSCLQVDGGVTFTEPCVIYSGSLEGQTDVRRAEGLGVALRTRCQACTVSRAEPRRQAGRRVCFLTLPHPPLDRSCWCGCMTPASRPKCWAA